MKHNFCVDCHYCNIDRKNAKREVRCVKYSRFIKQMDIGCDSFFSKQMYDILRGKRK